MAFGGAATFNDGGARTGQSRYEILEVTGLTLDVFVSSPPDRANADTGALSTNRGDVDPVPANTTSVPTEWGPGEDNWSQTDVDAITAYAQDLGDNVTRLVVTKALVANAGAAPAGKTNNNAEILVQNKGAALNPTGNMVIRLVLEHTVVR